MALETASYIHQLEPSNPAPTDQLRQADDHLRLIKQTLRQTFPNITGPITVSQNDLNNPSVIPVGLGAIWFLGEATVPSGWAVCDGRTVPLSDGSGNIVTPNMQGLIPMGANASYAVGALLGQPSVTVSTNSAGSHSHTVDGGDHTHSGTIGGHSLTVAEIPAHSHGNGINDSSDAMFSYGAKPAPSTRNSADNNSAGASLQGNTETIGSGAAHSHTLTIGTSSHAHEVSTAAAHAHSVQVPVLQPAMAILFIMKV